MKRLITALFFMSILSGKAQKVFMEEEFIAVVKKFHPVARQAAIDVGIAKANITSSRGAFDPLWNFNNSQKQFEGVTYYDQTVNEIKIPTWYGIDLHAGEETINGSRLNPEKTKGQLSYFGFTVPLLQNMIMDKRRAAVLQAKNLVQLSQVEQEIAMNDLLWEALEAYWTWWEQYHLYKLIEKGLNNAERRLSLVRTAYAFGDRPAIDTVEAFTQVQSFQVMLSEVFAAYTKSQINLSLYLWTNENVPFNLPEDVVPGSPGSLQVPLLNELHGFANRHPELLQYNIKLRGLQIDRKLKFQELLPEIKFRYNQLGRNFSSAVEQSFFQNNYKYGISVSMPLRFSQGRGEFAKAKMKIESAKLDQIFKKAQIDTKVKQYYTEWQQTQDQLVLQEGTLKNMQALQRAEELRFSNGESSLFLVNSREQKTIETEKKLIQLKAKNKTTHLKLLWSAGLFGAAN